MKITPENKIYIATELSNLSGGERSIRVKELSDYFGVSIATISRYTGDRVRKQRVDKGNSNISDAELKIIASRLLVSKQLKGKFTNSVKNAVEQLENEGFTFPVGYERICTLLREKGYDKESLSERAPHVRLISEHPNQVWQFDVTNCLQWHLDNKTGLTSRDIELTFYNNKLIKNAKKIKQELLRFVIVDHCSGAFFFWYYYTSGERAEDGADFFYKAFAPKPALLESTLGINNTMWQMQGVPKILVSDKGSILKQKAICNLMGTEKDEQGNIISGLQVKVELHAAGNPQAKGKVERLMYTIGTKFESILKIRRPKSLEELNQWALSWCIKHNETFRGKKEHSPAAYWLRITKEQLRLCPAEDVYKTLIHRHSIERTVDASGHVSFDGRQYFVPDVNAIKQKVLVLVNAYEHPSVDIHFNGKVWLCKPLDIDTYGRLISPANVTYGTFKAPAHNKQQKTVNELEDIASTTWGIQWKGSKQKRQSVSPAVGDEKVNPVVSLQPMDDKITYIQAAGTEIATTDIHQPKTAAPARPFTLVPPKAELLSERYIPVAEMINQYMREVGKLTVNQNKALKAKYSEKGVPLSDVDRIINNIDDVININKNMEEKHA